MTAPSIRPAVVCLVLLSGLMIGPTRADDDPVELAMTARAYRDQDDFDEAIRTLDRAIELDPDVSWFWRDRGICWLRKRQYDQAIANYTEAIRLDGTQADTYVKRAYAYSQHGDHARTIADCDTAIRLDPEQLHAWGYRGAAKLKQGDHDGAIADYDRVIRLDSTRAFAWEGRGHAWCGKEQFVRAIGDYTELIRLTPESASGYAWRAFAYSSLQDYDRALIDHDTAVRLAPGNFDHRLSRGVTLAWRGNQEGAIADYLRATEIDPGRAVAWRTLGNALFAKRDYAGAIARYDTAIRLQPDDAAIRYDRGTAHLWLAQGKHPADHLARAGEDFDAAIRLNPGNVEYWVSQAEGRLLRRDPAGAVVSCDAALRLAPKHGEALTLRSAALLAEGDYRRGAVGVVDAAQADSGWNLGFLKAALAPPGEIVAAAMAPLDEAIRREPRNAAHLVRRGQLWLVQGKRDRAIADFDAASKIDPMNAAAAEGRAAAMLRPR